MLPCHKQSPAKVCHFGSPVPVQQDVGTLYVAVKHLSHGLGRAFGIGSSKRCAAHSYHISSRLSGLPWERRSAGATGHKPHLMPHQPVAVSTSCLRSVFPASAGRAVPCCSPGLHKTRSKPATRSRQGKGMSSWQLRCNLRRPLQPWQGLRLGHRPATLVGSTCLWCSEA